MRLLQAWIIVGKEFSVLRKKKSLIISIILFPLLIAIGLPLIIYLIQTRNNIPAAALLSLLDAFSFFFIIVAGILPTSIASYSFVGERVEKSFEPLLATPTTDGEILLGKSIAAFLPPITAIYFSAVVFMSLMNISTYNYLGYLYFPNWIVGIIMLLVVPLAAILSIESSIVISIRVNDVRTAQQLGLLLVIPFGVIYFLSETGFISLEINNLFIISAILAIIDIILFFISPLLFRREKILTKEK